MPLSQQQQLQLQSQRLDMTTPCPPPHSRPVALSYAQPVPSGGGAPVPAYPSYNRVPSTASTTSSRATSYTQSIPVPPSHLPTYTAQTTLTTLQSNMALPPPPISSLTNLGIAPGRRPPPPPRVKRESFRPRASLMRGMSMIRAEAPPVGYGFDDLDEGEEGMVVDERDGMGELGGVEVRLVEGDVFE